MAADLYHAFPKAVGMIDQAEEILNFPLKSLMFGQDGDPEDEQRALTQTDVTQPALYTHSLVAATILQESGLRPNMAAGHSLGEYSALAAAGALGFEEGLRLVQLRGQLMARAGTVRPGSMAAVLNLDADVLDRVCEEVSETGVGIVCPANYNAPGQIVISGDTPAVERAMEAATEAGARRVVPLPVSGAFHSPLMADAVAGLADALHSATITTPACPVYLNVSGEPTTDTETIRRLLLEQLTSPVRWVQTLNAMQRDGAQRFIEIGTGNVLSGLVKRTLGRELETLTAGTSEELTTLTS